jgi:hypothetical protein
MADVHSFVLEHREMLKDRPRRLFAWRFSSRQYDVPQRKIDSHGGF